MHFFSSSGLKIGGAIALLTGGGLVAGFGLYSYNEDFRKFVNQSLPIIETFNLALGPATGTNNNNNTQNDEEESLLKPRNVEVQPIVSTKQVDKEKSPEKKVKILFFYYLRQRVKLQ